VKVLVDMNLSPAWVEFLAAAGLEAVHWSNVGPGDASDDELMRWAANHEHVVLTADLDFAAILAATRRRKPSVIQVRSENLGPQAIGAAVNSAIRQARVDLAEGAIVSVEPSRSRLRVLPLSD
jgi:predicted nuclease of predicted toxin-antitoxin system